MNDARDFVCEGAGPTATRGLRLRRGRSSSSSERRRSWRLNFVRSSRHVLLAALCQLLLTTATFGQQKSVSIESSPMQPSVALGRPMLTWWDVKIQGSGLVVGTFRFTLKSDGYRFATVETEELTLNGPEQRIRVMLPAVDCPQMIDRLYVDISFEGKKYSGDLGQQILRVPFSSKTVFMGLVGESRTVRKRSPQRDQLLERMRFENIIPDTKNLRGDENESEYVKTIFASIDPVDFPSEPIGYCGFDVVILMKEEFRNLRKPQVEGLLAWIKAGGSLYIEPNGILEPYHLAFLRSLTADDSHGLIFQLDPAGKLPADTVPPDQAAVAVKCGLGDAVIRTEDPDSEIQVSTKAWRAIVGPLWKSRFQSLERTMVQTVIGIGPDGQPIREARSNPDPFGFSMALFNRISLRPAELLDRLMPEGVRMVPLSLLAMILIGFVCLIGPGDYFGLGWLRARKFTWITFPAATLGVTALTVWLSNSYMTAAETRRALVIRDLGSQGELVRTNRFELLFVASTHQVTTEVEKGLFTSLNASSPLDRVRAAGGLVFVQNGQVINYSGGPAGTIGSDGQITQTVTTQVEGRIPTQFKVTQDLAKWTPQINRVMSIPGMAAIPEIDWSEFDLKLTEEPMIRSRNLPPQLLSRIQTRFGPQAMVACFTGKEGWASDRSPGWRSARSINMGSRPQFVPVPNVNQNTSVIDGMMWEADLFRWIYQASVTVSDQGALALTSRTTPKGGAVCDDLQILDTSDPRAWLLVIIVPEKDDFVAYRKLMRFQD